MPHIDAMTQNYRGQKLSASDTNAIRRCVNVTDEVTSREVALIYWQFF